MVVGARFRDSGPQFHLLLPLLCKHYTETCAIAVAQSEIVGFVTAYFPPNYAGTIFVWQIGSTRSMHDQGLATRLLQEVLQRDVCRGGLTDADTDNDGLKDGYEIAEELNPLQSSDCHDWVCVNNNRRGWRLEIGL